MTSNKNHVHSIESIIYKEEDYIFVSGDNNKLDIFELSSFNEQKCAGNHFTIKLIKKTLGNQYFWKDFRNLSLKLLVDRCSFAISMSLVYSNK